VVHVLFLLTQEVRGDTIEGIGAKFVLTQNHLEHIELDTSLDVYIFRLSRSQSLRTESIILNPAVRVLDTAQQGEFVHVKRLSAVNDVGEVEVDNVVASDNIRVDFKYEISPSLQ
jgi:hypothetical protein